MKAKVEGVSINDLNLLSDEELFELLTHVLSEFRSRSAMQRRRINNTIRLLTLSE